MAAAWWPYIFVYVNPLSIHLNEGWGKGLARVVLRLMWVEVNKARYLPASTAAGCVLVHVNTSSVQLGVVQLRDGVFHVSQRSKLRHSASSFIIAVIIITNSHQQQGFIHARTIISAGMTCVHLYVCPRDNVNPNLELRPFALNGHTSYSYLGEHSQQFWFYTVFEY